jgi:hypothetical protein
VPSVAVLYTGGVILLHNLREECGAEGVRFGGQKANSNKTRHNTEQHGVTTVPDGKSGPYCQVSCMLDVLSFRIIVADIHFELFCGM